MEKNRVKEKILITVDADTGSFERKLRAIAKHAEALADELKQIDDGVCPACGSSKYVTATMYGEDNKAHASASACDSCGYEEAN